MRKVNLFDCELDWHDERGSIANRGTKLGPKLGAQKIGAGLYDIEEGFWVWPYHYHHGVEEWLLVITGEPTLRTPEGERLLAPGDTVCFPSGTAGAHAVRGPGRILMIGARRTPSVVVYPDSDKLGTRPAHDGDRLNFPRSAAVGYWEGEA